MANVHLTAEQKQELLNKVKVNDVATNVNFIGSVDGDISGIQSGDKKLRVGEKVNSLYSNEITELLDFNENMWTYGEVQIPYIEGKTWAYKDYTINGFEIGKTYSIGITTILNHVNTGYIVEILGIGMQYGLTAKTTSTFVATSSTLTFRFQAIVGVPSTKADTAIYSGIYIRKDIVRLKNKDISELTRADEIFDIPKYLAKDINISHTGGTTAWDAKTVMYPVIANKKYTIKYEELIGNVLQSGNVSISLIYKDVNNTKIGTNVDLFRVNGAKTAIIIPPLTCVILEVRFMVSLATPNASPITVTWKGFTLFEGEDVNILLKEKALPGNVKLLINKKQNYLSKKAATLNNGESLTLDFPNIKKNYVFSFNCTISQFQVITLAHGTDKPYASGFIEIDNTNITAYRYLTQKEITGTHAHGLTISDTLNVIIKVNENNTADVILTTVSGQFKKNIYWAGCYGGLSVINTNSILSNTTFSAHCTDFSKDVWAFGDSYFDMWTYKAIQNGYGNFLMDGYSGRNSESALLSLKTDLLFGTPKKILWCMGMNDGDGVSAINSSWYSVYLQLIDICKSNNIELMLITIPNVPSKNHTFKNDIVRNSGYRYVDISQAVGADISTSWYAGLLGGDNVHPTDKGSNYIYAKIASEIPEICNR